MLGRIGGWAATELRFGLVQVLTYVRTCLYKGPIIIMICKTGGGKNNFPPRWNISSLLVNSSPIELKIELCTYRSNSDMIKFLKQKSDMFWYPPGPIFKSNFQNGARNKPEKIKKTDYRCRKNT